MAASTKKIGMIGLCRWALKYAFHRWIPLTGVLATMLLKVGMDVLKPWPMVFLVGYVLPTNPKPMPPWLSSVISSLPGEPTRLQLVNWGVAATVLIFLCSWALGLAGAYANISLGQRMVYDLASDLFAKLQQLSLRFHYSRSVGDNIRRVTADCASVSTIVKDAMLPIVSSIGALALMFVILWRLDPTLTVWAVAVVPFMIAIFYFHARPMLERSYQQQQIEARIYQLAEEIFAAIPVVQAFCREDLNDAR